MNGFDFEGLKSDLGKLQRPPEELLQADLTGIREEKVLDVRGRICPYPADLALETLRSMDAGQVLKEITDQVFATHNVPRVVGEAGVGRVLGIREAEPGLYAIYIRRT